MEKTKPKRVPSDPELAVAYADERLMEKGHLTRMDHKRMKAAFEAGMAKQRELDDNRDQNRNELAKAYIKVCRTLGIDGNIVGFVNKLGSVAERLCKGIEEGNPRRMSVALREYRIEFKGMPWQRPKEETNSSDWPETHPRA